MLKTALIAVFLLLVSSEQYGEVFQSTYSIRPIRSRRDVSKHVVEYPNGDKYTGDYVDNKATGQGVFTWSANGKWAGHKYEGQFKDDNFHGRGTYYYANGNKYTGDYINNKATGQGVFTWSANGKLAGDKYEGQFKDGNFHGRGTYYYANGDKYTGDWVNNKATGQGVFTRSANGTSTIPTSSSTTPAKRALLLTDDAYADANNVLSNYMRASNVALTVIHGGIENYTGSPNASTFNVVIFFPIKWFGVDMPVSGQEAILNAQKAGTGIVLTEWASWRVHQQNQWHILAPLCLTYPKGYAFVPHITFTNLMQYHPIWNALPTTFTSVIPTSTSTNYVHGTGTMLVAKCEICGGSLLGVVVQDQSSEGKGRIVQINHGVNANGSLWDIDRNITQLMVNSVNWAAEFT